MEHCNCVRRGRRSFTYFCPCAQTYLSAHFFFWSPSWRSIDAAPERNLRPSLTILSKSRLCPVRGASPQGLPQEVRLEGVRRRRPEFLLRKHLLE